MKTIEPAGTAWPTDSADAGPPAELPMPLYRSEAFAEDLDGLLSDVEPARTPPVRVGRSALMFVLPLAVVLIGSASALAWA